jgi:hypothetical protein
MNRQVFSLSEITISEFVYRATEFEKLLEK